MRHRVQLIHKDDNINKDDLSDRLSFEVVVLQQDEEPCTEDTIGNWIVKIHCAFGESKLDNKKITVNDNIPMAGIVEARSLIAETYPDHILIPKQLPKE